MLSKCYMLTLTLRWCCIKSKVTSHIFLHVKVLCPNTIHATKVFKTPLKFCLFFSVKPNISSQKWLMLMLANCKH